VLDDLDDEIKKTFHARILKNDDLHAFLRFGKCYRSLTLSEWERESAFTRFLVPYLVERFSDSLRNALSEGDTNLLSNLVRTDFPFSDNEREVAYRPAKNYFKSLSTSLESKKEVLKESKDVFSILPDECFLAEQNSERLFNPFRCEDRVQPKRLFVESLLRSTDLDSLNILPEEFQDLRNNIAIALEGIAVAVSNDLDEEEVSALVFARALEINCGAKDREHITQNLAIVTANLNRNRISELKKQLAMIAADIRGRRFMSAGEVAGSVLRIFDTAALSRISSTELDTSIIGLTKQVTEIAWLLRTSYSSPPDGIRLVVKCLEIRLSERKVSSALWKNLTDSRAQLEKSSEQTTSSPTSGPTAAPKSGVRYQAPRESRENTDPSKVAGYKGKKSRDEGESFTFGGFGNAIRDDRGLVSSLVDRLLKASLYEIVVAIGAILVVSIVVFLGGFSGPTGLEKTHYGANHGEPSASASVQSKSLSTQDSQNPVGLNLSTPNAAPTATTTPAPTPSPVVSRPETGDVLVGHNGRGLGQLSVSNGLSVDAIVRVRKVGSVGSYREVYVRAGGSVSIGSISPGDYEVLFATGYDYAPRLKKFLSNASYQKFDESFSFYQIREEGGIRYRTYQVSLNKVLNGTASSSTTDENDFNR